MNMACFPDIRRLDQGLSADENQILAICDFIDKRYDCADFRMICILRSLYFYADLITPSTLTRMKATVLGFKYWMDEPGTDSMCYWSENHQVIFGVCEYLAGQLYPDEIFINDGNTGAYHQAKALDRLEHWLEAKSRFGFVEWHSNTYYEEDVAPLSLLVDCADDQDLVEKALRVLDLLFLDMALHHYRSYLAATSGRCYKDQKKYPHKQDVADIMQKAFNFQEHYEYDYSKVGTDFLLNRTYRLPQWILDIAHDRHLGEVKVSMGLNLSEVNDYFPDLEDINGRAMFLWSMEAFTNPESAAITLKLYKDWNLKKNQFLQGLSALDIPILSRLGLLPLTLRILNPVTSGIAIQRVNSYSYRTPHYFMSSAQKYHPGTFGDQQHIWQATFGRGYSVFTTHPAISTFEAETRNATPSHWVGNGIHPDCRQDRNVLLCAYDLTVRRGYMERERLLYTHAWFPEDMERLSAQCVLAKDGDSYIALFSLKPMDDELRQHGKVTAWACVCGSKDEHSSFSEFRRLCETATFTRKGKVFTFNWDMDHYELHYKKAFKVNGELKDPNYPRLECKYGIIERDSPNPLSLT